MKAIYTLVILLTIFSLTQCGALDFIGDYLSYILRADILDIIDCILHNDIIIKDVNIILDAVLTKNFDNVITALLKVVGEIVDPIKNCINNPPPTLH